MRFHGALLCQIIRLVLASLGKPYLLIKA
ncbi:Protein of unknown function [Bacillus mycoides]|nr:Protein of unknown function [Bacillus mycoides]